MECSQCGKRINPYTVLNAGVVSQREFNENFLANPILSWCEEKQGWVRDTGSCPAWISYNKYEGENNYRPRGS